MSQTSPASTGAAAAPDPGYDADFYLDTACPWCWITSRWVSNVQAERDYKVRWKFISLKVLNEGSYDPDDPKAKRRSEAHAFAFGVLRACHAVREAEGNDAIGRLYTVIGNALHTNGRARDGSARDVEAFLRESLTEAGLDPAYAAHVHDESHDEPLRAETAEALSRTGPDVGTPIITFFPDTDRAVSLFGPVIPKAPKGGDAAELWDAVVKVAESGVAEIKRTMRGDISFD